MDDEILYRESIKQMRDFLLNEDPKDIFVKSIANIYFNASKIITYNRCSNHNHSMEDLYGILFDCYICNNALYESCEDNSRLLAFKLVWEYVLACQKQTDEYVKKCSKDIYNHVIKTSSNKARFYSIEEQNVFYILYSKREKEYGFIATKFPIEKIDSVFHNFLPVHCFLSDYLQEKKSQTVFDCYELNNCYLHFLPQTINDIFYDQKGKSEIKRKVISNIGNKPYVIFDKPFLVQLQDKFVPNIDRKEDIDFAAVIGAVKIGEENALGEVKTIGE